MKLLPTIIEYCNECHHAHSSAPPPHIDIISFKDPTCKKGPKSKPLTNYPTIPDWCPLEDTPTTL